MKDDRSSDGTNGESTRTRRRVLAGAGIVGAGLLAGCLGNGDGSSDATPTDEAMNGASNGMEPTDGMGGGMNGTEAADGMDGMGTADGMDGMGAADRMDGTDGGSSTATAAPGDGWHTVELTAVRRGETFTVAGLDGPVVVETFAVWCPKCTRQQRKMTDLGDDVTVVSLNVDPNESAEKVRRHADDHGFDWRYAVAPPKMTRSLVDEFGAVVTNAPSTPVIVACDDGSASVMSGKIHSAAEITAATDEC